MPEFKKPHNLVYKDSKSAPPPKKNYFFINAQINLFSSAVNLLGTFQICFLFSSLWETYNMPFDVQSVSVCILSLAVESERTNELMHICTDLHTDRLCRSPPRVEGLRGFRRSGGGGFLFQISFLCCWSSAEYERAHAHASSSSSINT